MTLVSKTCLKRVIHWILLLAVGWVAASCGESEPTPSDIFCPVDVVAPAEDGSMNAVEDLLVGQDAAESDAGDQPSACAEDPGAFGCPCSSNDDCDAGWCVEGSVGYVCTKSCLTECPEGYDCKSVYGGTDLIFLCVPRVLSLCKPCTEDVQCTGGACLSLDGETQCSYTCDVDSDCPSGFGCQEDPSGDKGEQRFCIPTTGSCSCNLLVSEGQRACSLTSDLGACYGCLLYTSPSPRDKRQSRMPSSA